jgi:hypothetical protein
MTLRDRLVGRIVAGEDLRAAKVSPRPGRALSDPRSADSAIVAGSILFIAGGLTWTAGTTAIGVVRPGLDSGLLLGPIVALLLIGCGTLIVAAVATSGVFAARWVRTGAAVAGIGGAGQLLGLIPALVGISAFGLFWLFGLPVVLVGSLATGVAIALRPGRLRLAGVGIAAGLVVGYISLVGPDPTGPALVLKAGAFVAAGLCFGFGWVAVGTAELARIRRERRAMKR